MTDIIIKKKNEVYLQITCEPHIKYELSEYFTFDVPNAKFMPQFKNKTWDGKIRLFSPHGGELYVGLLSHLTMWADEMGYSYTSEYNQYYGEPKEVNELISPEGVKDYVDYLAQNLKPRPYQYQAIYQALRHYRKVIL